MKKSVKRYNLSSIMKKHGKQRKDTLERALALV